MLEVIRLIGRAASTDRNVLVVGEKGTGKSIVAKALHYESQRRSGPFVVIDTTYISPGLIEDALLGHVRGAFSSAYYDSPGLIETADGGTVFLDNVDTIPLPIQAKLVAPLNSHSVRRLGAAATRTVDFRIVSASCVPLGSLVEKGLFRMDLYLTLRVLEITLPGLAERGADIFDLATHFLKRFAQRAGKPVRGFSKEALDALASQSWPGNVAELEKRIERAVVLCAGETISLKEIQSDYLEGAKTSPALESSKDFAELSEVSSAMVQSAGNVTHAAKHLGISRRQLHRLLNKHDLSPGQFKGGTGKRTTHPGDSTPGD
jgi:two-component system NtrC family response regulator